MDARLQRRYVQLVEGHMNIVLLAMLDALEHYSLEQLHEFARIALPQPRPPGDGDV